ncbi:MAG: hypothetical protein RBR59_08360 [Sulfurimonadaceae bacterium]|jgi:hypothetical protein|nr:hypothetical protein [Sulfurimonadaceae bacterium]
MSKKDRISIVVSAIYFMLPLATLLDGSGVDFIVFTVPLILYWGYRFIKNDISFF